MYWSILYPSHLDVWFSLDSNILLKTFYDVIHPDIVVHVEMVFNSKNVKFSNQKQNVNGLL